MKRQWPMYEPKSPMCASLRGRCLTCSMPQLWIGRCIQFGRLVVKTHPSAAWQTTDLPRGGIRVSDEPEKPGFRFRIPFYPPKTRVNPDFRVFMPDFPPKNRVKPVFRSIQNLVSSKCHYPPHPYIIPFPVLKFLQPLCMYLNKIGWGGSLI